ncbi:PaaI family thioesterase [Sneathiella limimaris]|uniref:PaaI family thioesterase n=1 Tax=Sneathiella limimaris TaxID=1964213 RepID=UPI00146C25CE|nr:PaaI family thioesterase [Sneathiella limimaris]
MSEAFDITQIQNIIDIAIPHCSDIGVQVESLSNDSVVMKLPYDERFVGNPVTGVLHGGIVTTLIDTTSGMCIYAKLQKYIPIATLDLRIDYLKSAEPGKDVLAEATCYRLTRQIGFVRAVAYHDNPDDPIANSVSTFMLHSSASMPLDRVSTEEGGNS